MAGEREAQFLKLVADFPDSPMGHYSLGKLYLESSRYVEAVASLGRAVALSPDYAAALLALGSAQAGAGQTEAARQTFRRAQEVALSQKHPTLADEAEALIADLD